MQKYKNIALIVAAGSGKRAGGNVPKQYAKIAGRAVLTHTIETFLTHSKIDAIRVVYNPEYDDLYKAATEGMEILAPVKGGATRQESVRLGLESLKEYMPERVLIHDAARMFISNEIISNVLSAIEKNSGAIAAIALEDTLKISDGQELIKTIPRDNLMRAQTPQGFFYDEILNAHIKLSDNEFTDDAALFEHLGKKVKHVKGAQENFKITASEDLQRAAAIMERNYNIRIGNGFDVHKFCEPKLAENNHIMLCGIAIPHDKSLEGHSDADVGLHALVDAILGALAMGDIGDHFPPSDDKFKGMDSRIFLEFARDVMVNKNASISNIDITIICEKPKLMPYKRQMAEKIADILKINNDMVSVKATTTEKLGFTGRGEGIAAQASVCLKVF